MVYESRCILFTCKAMVRLSLYLLISSLKSIYKKSTLVNLFIIIEIQKKMQMRTMLQIWRTYGVWEEICYRDVPTLHRKWPYTHIDCCSSRHTSGECGKKQEQGMCTYTKKQTRYLLLVFALSDFFSSSNQSCFESPHTARLGTSPWRCKPIWQSRKQ